MGDMLHSLARIADIDLIGSNIFMADIILFMGDMLHTLIADIL